jgi:hypothetical protein
VVAIDVESRRTPVAGLNIVLGCDWGGRNGILDDQILQRDVGIVLRAAWLDDVDVIFIDGDRVLLVQLRVPLRRSTTQIPLVGFFS